MMITDKMRAETVARYGEEFAQHVDEVYAVPSRALDFGTCAICGQPFPYDKNFGEEDDAELCSSECAEAEELERLNSLKRESNITTTEVYVKMKLVITHYFDNLDDVLDAMDYSFISNTDGAEIVDYGVEDRTVIGTTNVKYAPLSNRRFLNF